MRSNPLYTSPLVDLYRTIGLQRGASPAFINASIAQGINESSLDPNAVGDGGQARGLHQWHPDRYQSLLALSQKMNLPPTDPRVQINHWYDENKKNLGISDPRAANDAALGSERPAGWKPGDPTGVPSYDKRLGDTMALMRLTAGQSMGQDPSSFSATAGPNAPNPSEPISEQTLVPGQQENPLDNVGSSLVNLGAIVAGLDRKNPGMANALQGVASNMATQQRLNQAQNGWDVSGFTDDKKGVLLRNKATGEIKVTPLDPRFQGEDTTLMTTDYKNYRLGQKDPEFAQSQKDKDQSLTDDGVRSMADRMQAGEKVSMSRLSKADVARVQNELASRGIDPQEILGNQATQAGRQQEARTGGRNLELARSASQKFTVGFERAIENNRLLDRGQFVPYNKLQQLVQSGTSNKQLAVLGQNLETVVQEYAKAISPTGNALDRDKQEARKRLSTAMSPEALDAVLNEMKIEVDNSLAAQEKANANRFNKKTIRDNESSGSSTPKRLKYNPATGELE